MEDIPFEKGIFIHSKNIESKFLIENLQSLLETCPTIKITSVECDERFGGFKVCFGDTEARLVLEKQELKVTDRRISVYPLETYLLVHEIPTRENCDIERDVTDTIQEKFGKVLNLQKLPTEKDANSYLVFIDIPEITGLSIFSRNGYPNRMSLTVPSMCKTFKVTFWCRRCKTYGHSHQECFQKSQSHNKENEKQISIVKTESAHPDIERSSGNPTNSVMKSGIRLDPTISTISGVSHVLESTDTFEYNLGKELVMNESVITTENNASVPGDATSTTDADDEIQSLISIETANRDQWIQSESEDELSMTASAGSPDKIKKEPLSTTDLEDNSHDSFPETQKASKTPTTRRRKKPASSSLEHNVTSCLSPRLQDCINQAYKTYTILDRDELNAFLTHVKKKSNPMVFARNYTEDVQGLKNQLKEILNIYYKTPQTGTKDDIQFIKWLTGLVNRFDGPAPRKRKSGRKSPNETPIKK